MGQLASQLFHGQVCVIPSLSQLQWADKRSRVNLKCAICIWNLLLSTVKMRSKELSLSVKQAIIRLKKQNKPIREIAKTLGVAKTTVWNILKKKERTGELSNTKRPGRPRKTTVVDDWIIISLVKKTPFTTVGQIKKTLQEVGVWSGYILPNRLPTTPSNRQSKLWYTPFTNTRWVTRKAQCYFLFSQHGTIERHKARGLRSKRRGTSKKNSKLKFTQTGINSQVLVKYWLLFIAELLERNYIWNIRL